MQRLISQRCVIIKPTDDLTEQRAGGRTDGRTEGMSLNDARERICRNLFVVLRMALRPCEIRMKALFYIYISHYERVHVRPRNRMISRLMIIAYNYFRYETRSMFENVT